MTQEKLLRAIDRVELLIKEVVLRHEAENIFVNAPVAIHQIAFQNELNGILLGLGLSGERILKLPITKDRIKSIKSALKALNTK